MKKQTSSTKKDLQTKFISQINVFVKSLKVDHSKKIKKAVKEASKIIVKAVAKSLKEKPLTINKKILSSNINSTKPMKKIVRKEIIKKRPETILSSRNLKKAESKAQATTSAVPPLIKAESK